MSYEIRAMSLAELLDTSFQLLRDRFLTLVGLALLVQLPFAVLMGPLLRDPTTMQKVGENPFQVTFAVIVLGVVMGLLAMPWLTAAITRAVGDLFLGRAVRFGSAALAGLRYLVPLALTSLVYWVVALVVCALATGLFALLVILSPVPLAGSKGAAALVPIVLVMVLFGVLYVAVFTPSFVLAQLVVLEDRRYFDAVRRAFELVSGYRMRVAGIAFVAWVLVAIPVGGLGFIGLVWPWVGALVSGVGQAIASAFGSAAMVVLYFDLRCRKEAFDLEHLAHLVDARAGAGA